MVIAILGLLVALLLPAVQAARESARRSSCTNKLKQLGVSLHLYHDAYNVFPPAEVANRDCGDALGITMTNTPDYVAKNINGLVLLLPFLEEQSLYDQFDFDYAFDSGGSSVWVTSIRGFPYPPLAGGGTGPNGPLVARQAPAPFACPSDSLTARNGMTLATLRRKPNYDFIVPREIVMCSKWARRTASTRTMFEDGSTCRPSHISDGMSNTVALAETWRDCCCNGYSAEWAKRGWTEIGLNLSHAPPNTTTFGAVPVDCNNGRTLGDYTNVGSKHPGGTNMVMGDGAVRFLQELSDTTVRQRLERIGDGQASVGF